MSSPVSLYLRNLRLRAGMTQLDFAHSIGYEQAYVSAIELGLKSPSQEFLAKLVVVMALSGDDHRKLEMAQNASKRRFTLPPESSIQTFTFCNELWEKLDRLHPALLEAMRVILNMEDQITERPRHQPTRLRRRSKQEVPM